MPTLTLAATGQTLTYQVELWETSPEAAYAAWASELGVSSTETLQSMNDDDAAFAVDLAAPWFAGSASTSRVFFSSEGGLGFYTAAPSSQMLTQYATVASVSRMFGWATYPPLLLIFRSNSGDLRSTGAKLQRAGSTTILYAAFDQYSGSGQNASKAALRITPTSIELVGSAINADAAWRWVEFPASGTISTPTSDTQITGLAGGTIKRLTASIEASSAQGRWSHAGPLAAAAFLAAARADARLRMVSPLGAQGGTGEEWDYTIGGAPTPRLVASVAPMAALQDAGPLGAPALFALPSPHAWLSVAGPLGAARLLVARPTEGRAATGTMLGQSPRLRATLDAMALLSVGAPSLLGGALVGFIDFSGQLAPTPARYVLDLMVDGQPVRVPISTWQATLQLEQSNFVQASIPACLPWVDAIQAASELVIKRVGRTLAGEVVEVEMARAPLENWSVDQGPTNATATISGYTEGFPGGAPEASESEDRTLTGVRSLSYSAGSARVRAAIDWILRPGMTVRLGERRLVASYINYYVPATGDAYMDVGERT